MKFNLDIPKIGYFIVYKKQEGFHPFEKLIYDEQVNVGFSKEEAEYVHVEISGGGNEAISANFPKVELIKIMKKHKGRYAKIVAYRDSSYMRSKRYKVGFFGATMNNLPYGIFSLLWFKINHFVFKKNNILASRFTPFCSFNCSYALKKVFPNSFENSSTVMPAEFLDSKKFNIIWEGIVE